MRQSRDTHTGRWQTKEKTYYYTKTKTNKTWALIQTTGGKDEPAIIFIFRNGQPYSKISLFCHIYGISHLCEVKELYESYYRKQDLLNAPGTYSCDRTTDISISGKHFMKMSIKSTRGDCSLDKVAFINKTSIWQM